MVAGVLKRAQDGMRKATVTSPARKGSPAAFASSARSRRRSASPEAPLVEPSVPIAIAARGDLGAGCGQRPLPFDADNAFPRRASVLHARHDLLAHIAAFLEVDAVQLVEQGIMRKGVAIGVVASALGHTEPDPPCMVIDPGGKRAAKIGSARLRGEQDAKSERGEPGVGVSNRVLRQVRRLTPSRRHNERRLLFDLDFSPQAVEQEPLHQRARLRLAAFQQIAVPFGHHKKIEQNPPLGREQTGMNRGRRSPLC